MDSSLAIPRISARPTAYWLSDENTQITESQPTLGTIGAQPQTVAVLIEGTRLLRVQSPELVDRVLQREMNSAVGLGLDAAIINGSGSDGQPRGLSGVLTPVSGTSFAAAALDPKASVIAAGGRRPSIWVGPTTETKLRSRQIATGCGAVWGLDGVAGMPATATPAVANDVAVVGDFSALTVLIWGMPRLELNPYGNFRTGMWQARLLLDVNFVFAPPSAFAIATGVS